MATTDFSWASTAVPGGDIACKNTDGSYDLVAGDVVKIDATNIVSGTQGAPGVVRASADDYAFGVAVDAISKGSMGRIRRLGIAQVVSASGVTAGQVVEADNSGKVKTQVGAKAQLGQAMNTTTGDNQLLLVALAIANNA